MCDVEVLDKKKKALKSAIARYNTFNAFVEEYKNKKTLDLYIDHIKHKESNLSESVIENYNRMIRQYQHGNVEPLLLNLYDRLLYADESKSKAAEDLKIALGKL